MILPELNEYFLNQCRCDAEDLIGGHAQSVVRIGTSERQ
jgi:hypothetical protein